MWQWTLCSLALAICAFSVGLIAYFASRSWLVGPGQSPASATQAWLTAFAGPLAILAALVAAVPVFQQLDETRLASYGIRIDIMRHTLETIDAEKKTVDDIVAFLQRFVRDPGKLSLCSDDNWNKVSYTARGFKTTPDRPDELARVRLEIADTLEKVSKEKQHYCDGRDDLLPAIKSAVDLLPDQAADYMRGYNNYKVVRVELIKMWEEKFEYELPEAKANAQKLNLFQ